MKGRTPGGASFWKYTREERARDKQACEVYTHSRALFESAVKVGTETAYFSLPDSVRAEFSILAFYRLVRKDKQEKDQRKVL